MKKEFSVSWRLLSGCLLFLALFNAAGWVAAPVHADPITATLDGVRDGSYVPIAADAAGDLASPGPADWTGTQWTDLTAMYVAADAANLYVYVDLPTYFFNSGDPGNDSSGQIGLAIDVDGKANSGGVPDPWGNAITFSFNHVDGFAAGDTFLPDYVIRGDVSNDGGWTEFRTWNGNWNTGSGVNWGGITGGGLVGTHVAYAYNQGVEFAIPLADIGSPDPAHVHLQFFTTQSGGGKGAYDTLLSDDQSTGWDDATTLARLVSVPVAIDPQGDLASPGPADWVGVAWTDMTRLHAWADTTDLHLFIPTEAYSSAVSAGQIGLAIDSQTGGGSSDPWGNAITFAYNTAWQNLGQTPVATATTLPDYVIRGNVFGPADNGWTELRAWSGSDWNSGAGVDWGGIGNSGLPSLPGSKVAWSENEGLRLTIPFSDIGAGGGDTINLEFFGTQGGGGKGAYDTVPSDDQSTGWDDATTQLVLATYTIPELDTGGGGGCASGAAQDDNVFWNDLGHNSRDTLYRTPGSAVTTGTAVTLRLRAACDDLTAARLRVWNDRLDVQYLIDMSRVASDDAYEWWEATVPASPEPTIYWYRFIALDGAATAYYEDDGARDGGWGQTYGSSPDNSWQLTVYDPAFQTPEWVKNGIIYQIFADRFRNGDALNDTPAGSFFYGTADGTIYRSNGADWNSLICDPRDPGSACPDKYSENFYGGDLQGILDKLDYLQDLGVTVLYLNPIFESPSNHKYDTTDYTLIDDNFGDLALFQLLTTEAHNRGIRVVLDGVFNHTSSDSIYFDRYNRYPTPDGACESETSQYRDWYYFQPAAPGTGPCAGDTDYESWFGFDTLPKLNSANAGVRNLIWSGGLSAVARYWMQWADGWRLDVGGDVDPGLTNNPGNDYWEGFRSAVHTTKPDAYIVGEEWGVATAWTLGSEWDATMNYQFSSAVLSFWRDTTFVDNDHNTASSAGTLSPLTPAQLDARLKNLAERYPPEAFQAMMNLLGSHDTNRPLFMLDENAGQNNGALYENPNYDWSDAIARLKGVALLQMTLPGAPTIYYGDEVGLIGPVTYDGSTWQDDPYNRLPYPWLDESGAPFYTHLQTQAGQDDLRNYYKALTGARNAHPALRTGSFDTLLVDDSNNVYAFGRRQADYSDAAVVIVNRATAAQAVTVDVSGYLPVGAQFTDVLDGNTAYTVDASGLLAVPAVPGRSGALLLLAAPIPAAPASVNDLAVTAVRNGEIDLAWSAAAGADSYDVYRSLLSGGGYTWIANTTATGYTDTGLTNAVKYHYVLVSRDDSTLLASGYSNEVQGIPSYDLTTAWYNLQWPPEIFHTISTSNRTENIYGQIYIPGATGGSTPAAGVWAQVGFGATNTSPTDPSWTWVDMAYNTAQGNNDEYYGSLLPDTLGDFDYVTRWSSDGGLSWFYSDLGGPGDNNQPGLLHVLPSSDTTAPAAPTGLAVEATSSSSISLSWQANTEPDLAGYEVFRQNVAAPGFARIVSLGAGAAAYVDESVATNETYNYYLLAFDSSFNRSAPSNTVQATAEPRLVAVTFNVTVPSSTPGTVHIAGSIPEFGPWNPGLVPMTQVDGTTWTYSLNLLDGTAVEYKFTRGTWETVEKEADGNTEIANRPLTVDYGLSGEQVVNVSVANWRDPIVVSHTPAGEATGVPPDAAVSVVWNQAMNPASDFEVAGPAGPLSGTFGYDGASFTVTFTPTLSLAENSVYTVTVAGQSDAAGDGQEVATQWSFTTSTLTPQERIDLLMADVAALVAAGELTPAQGNGLLAKLESARLYLDQGNEQLARRDLHLFIRDVKLLINHDHLPAEDGQQLIETAEEIIDQIKNG